MSSLDDEDKFLPAKVRFLQFDGSFFAEQALFPLTAGCAQLLLLMYVLFYYYFRFIKVDVTAPTNRSIVLFRIFLVAMATTVLLQMVVCRTSTPFQRHLSSNNNQSQLQLANAISLIALNTFFVFSFVFFFVFHLGRRSLFAGMQRNVSTAFGIGMPPPLPPPPPPPTPLLPPSSAPSEMFLDLFRFRVLDSVSDEAWVTQNHDDRLFGYCCAQYPVMLATAVFASVVGMRGYKSCM